MHVLVRGEAGRRRRSRRLEQRPAVLQQAGRRAAARVLVPEPPVRAHEHRRHRAPGRVHRDEPAGGQVVAEQLAAPRVVVGQEQRRRVRVPPGVHLAGQVQVQVGHRVRLRRPDGRPEQACPLAQDDQPLVARHPRPLARPHGQAGAVPQVGDRPAGPVEHAERRVPAVAVLAVGDGQQPLVPGQPLHARVLAVRVEPLDRAVAGGQPDPAAGVGGRAHDREAAAERQAGRVARLHAGRRRPRVGPALERLRPPRPRLVPALVVEPPDGPALRVERAGPRALRPAGHLPARAGRPVPRVQLEAAALVGVVDEAVRGVPGPGGQGHGDGAEAPAPGGLFAHPRQSIGRL